MRWSGLVCGVLLLLCLLLGMRLPMSATPTTWARQPAPSVSMDLWELRSVTDWQGGIVSGLIISNNADGELRLAAGQESGSFLSVPWEAALNFHAVGAFWNADLSEGTDIVLEIRGRATPPSLAGDGISDEVGWGAWQQLVSGDAVATAHENAFATPTLLAFPNDTRYLQLRVQLQSTIPQASPFLNDMTLVVFDAAQGPATTDDLSRIPILAGPSTRTPRPDVLSRQAWSDTTRAPVPGYAQPRAIVLHQIDPFFSDNAPILEDTLPFLRALATYQPDILGWDDLSYHYLIDHRGILYEGRLGGPTSTVTQLSGGTVAVHVALIGSLDSPPTEAAQQTLVSLIAWLGEAYAISPTGEHRVALGERVVRQPNVLGHSDVSLNAIDPGEAFRALLPEIRTRATQQTIRVRWYFAEGNSTAYDERLVLFYPDNPVMGDIDPATVHVTLLPEGSTDVVHHTVEIPRNGRVDLVVRELLPDNPGAAAIIEANAPVFAERTMQLPSDMESGPGIAHLSRLWYLAEGSTADTFQTYLVLFNPQDTPVEAVITYMQGDGAQADQSVPLPPRQRVVVTVGDVLANIGFGARVVASQPIAVERTMRFGADSGGFHVSPGITTLSRRWYFAEGTTDAPFQMRILLLNPHAQPATTSVTFMTPDGTSLMRRYVIPATTRLVVDVNEIVPTLGVATEIVSDRPIVAERALYFSPTDTVDLAESDVVTTTERVPPARNVPLLGSVSMGTTEPSHTWYFAEGQTINARAFLLLSNPNAEQARVTIETVLHDSVQTHEVVMPANARYTVALHDLYPGNSAVSVIVQATQPIVAERSLFPLGEGQRGGSTSPGMPAP